MRRILSYWLAALVLLSGAVRAEDYPQLAPEGLEWGWQGHVQFALNSAKLRAEDLPLLDTLAASLTRYPHVSVLLTGHTDNTGSLGYNQQLSVRRGDAVAAYLVSRGVDAARIFKRAQGEQRPVASNTCDPDRQRNRRVDLAFFPTGDQPPAVEEMPLPESAPDRRTEQEECP
jgi:outer membrane protein OmpA-like peptidoglycan-associated protein